MPVMDCNTNAYLHTHKYTEAIEKHADKHIQKVKASGYSDGLAPEAAVDDLLYVGFGDGQTFNIGEGARKHWKRLYRRWIWIKGPFHSEAHFNFGAYETFASCLTIWASRVLERTIDESERLRG